MKGRKGTLEEILSKAKFYDDIDLYRVYYRDFDSIASTTLKEFIFISSNFESIPASRIVEIRKGSDVIYSKSRTDNSYAGLLEF